MQQGAAVSVGAVLGTGVVGLPALGAQIAGPASLIAWAGLIVLAVPLAATFAALGSRYPDAGGVSTYVRKAFGPRAASVVGWCFYFAIPAGSPAAALFGAAYVSAAVGGGHATEMLTCVALVAAVTVSNIAGVRVSGRVQFGLAATLVTLLLVTTILALPHARAANLHPFAPHGWPAIVSAAGVLVWAFAGWEAVTSLAADFRHPRRDLPRATAIALVIVGVLYFAVAATSILVLGPTAGTTAAPLSNLLAVAVGGPVKMITAVIALLLTLGTMNAYFAGGAKLGAALGRDGALPSWVAKGSEVGGTARRGLVVEVVFVSIALVLVQVGLLNLRTSVLATTGAFVLVYLFASAAAIKLLPRATWARRGAVIAFVSAAGLAIIVGPYLAWAVAIALAALTYDAIASKRRAGAIIVAGRLRPSPKCAPDCVTETTG